MTQQQPRGSASLGAGGGFQRAAKPQPQPPAPLQPQPATPLIGASAATPAAATTSNQTKQSDEKAQRAEHARASTGAAAASAQPPPSQLSPTPLAMSLAAPATSTAAALPLAQTPLVLAESKTTVTAAGGSSAEEEEEEEGEEEGGYFITAQELALTQQLQAAHAKRGEEIDDLTAQIEQQRKKMSSMQAAMEALEKERVNESASFYASTEQLRSDLARETQQLSAAKVQLAQRGSELQSLSRDRDALSVSLRQHTLELTSTAGVIGALRERIGVLEAIQAQMEAERSAAASSVEASGLGDAAPLHHTVQARKLARLELELQDARRTVRSHQETIQSQWGQLENLKRELLRLQEERDRAEAASAGNAAAALAESSVRFAGDASTSSLLLQLHQAHERIQRLEAHNRVFLRKFYMRVAAWCCAVILLCWIIMAAV